MTKVGFYEYAAPLVNSLEDDHTGFNPPVNEFIREGHLVIPLNVRLNAKDRSLTVRSSNEIPNEASIVSINNIPALKIADKIMTYAHGETWISKAALINQAFFFFYYFLDHSDTFNVKYNYNGAIEEKVLNGVPWHVAEEKKEKVENTNNKSVESYKQNYSFSEITPETVLFKMKSFGRIHQKDYYDNFIDSLFIYLKDNDVQNLIIDVRDNPGGYGDIPYFILEYISPVKFRLGSINIYRFNNPGDNHDNNSRIMKKEYVNGEWVNVYSEPEEYSKPLAHSERFHGKVYLLTNNNSYSASAILAGGIKEYKLGVIVGEETGGASWRFGSPIAFTLPNTKLNYFVATGKYFKNAKEVNRMHGVIPDVEVPSEQALDRALELISKKKK